MANPVNAIATAISEIFGFLRDLNDPDKREKRLKQVDVKRYKLAINAGESFILLTHKLDGTLIKKQRIRTVKMRKNAEDRFFKYNQ